jgi:repressor LexA
MSSDRFALQVTGNSMIDAGILDGDTVIIRQQQTATNGDIVVALIDGIEATLKRLKKLPDGMILLMPENKFMEPKVYPAQRVQIQGVVVGQLRSYQ